MQSDDPVDYRPRGHFYGLVKILIDTHCDEMGRGFPLRSGDRHILEHPEPQRATQGSLRRRQIDLAVALRGMAVSNRKQRAGMKHRQIKRRASGQFGDVQIAAERPGDPRGLALVGSQKTGTGRDAHDTEKAAHGNPDPLVEQDFAIVPI